MPDVYYVEGLKDNLMRIGHLIQKGYRVYMEDNHCVINDIHPSKQMIEKVHMKIICLFSSRIGPYMKQNTTQVVHEGWNENSGATFKAEIKEVDKHYYKEEKDNAEIQVEFQ